jgi:hypothetical protein
MAVDFQIAFDTMSGIFTKRATAGGYASVSRLL